MEKTSVLIVGAGLSGLTAANILKAAGRSVKIIEASDDIGGRVRTDLIDGFRMDRGFQVLLTAYPEAKKLLDYRALDLQYFEPGAIILNEAGSTLVADPLRRPLKLLQTLLSPAGTLKDKLLMLKLKHQLKAKTETQIFGGSQLSTLGFLQRYGFSERIIINFFKPFFGGVFLEDLLSTQSDMFGFLFKMFSVGGTAIPALGMGMIARQLARTLQSDEIIFNERVVHIGEGTVRTAKSQTYEASYILLATDENSIAGASDRQTINWKPVSNIYFIADNAPSASKMVLLNASANKLVNNVVVMNNISPYYAPSGKSLVSASLLGDFAAKSPHLLARQVADELSAWFPDAGNWRYLRAYHITHALPGKKINKNELGTGELRLSEHVFRCGDYLMNGSINAAMKSGRLAAEAILSL
jgi:phytoene dehydrogenase-like protein